MALLFQGLLLGCCLLQVIALSQPVRKWEGKVKTVKIDDADDTRHDHDYDFTETTNCKDHISTRRCGQAELKYKICEKERGRILCQKTCHVCHLKAPAPEVPCEKTALGCCWDGVTRVQGPNQEGCPKCKDDGRYAGLCKRWIKYCNSESKRYQAYQETVRQFCPLTCGICRVKTTRMTATLAPINPSRKFSNKEPRRGAYYIWTKRLSKYEN